MNAMPICGVPPQYLCGSHIQVWVLRFEWIGIGANGSICTSAKAKEGVFAKVFKSVRPDLQVSHRVWPRSSAHFQHGIAFCELHAI